MKTYTEQSRTIPVATEADVLVCGAGPAGVGAALGAARAGCRNVLLVESGNAVGGVSTSGMMSHWTGATESPLLDEICRAQAESSLLPDGERGKVDRHICHEALKNVYLHLLDEAGVKVRLYTQVVDAIVAYGRVRGVVVESKSGREAILAKVAIDATGDGDVAARAGAAFDMGRESDGKCQPVTLMFRLGGVDTGRAIAPGSFETTVDVPAGEIQALGRANLPAPAGHVLLYRQHLPGEMCVNMTNVTDIDGTDAEALSRAEIVCRSQMEAIVAFLRRYAPGYERCYIVASASQIGVEMNIGFTITGSIECSLYQVLFHRGTRTILVVVEQQQALGQLTVVQSLSFEHVGDYSLIIAGCDKLHDFLSFILLTLIAKSLTEGKLLDVVEEILLEWCCRNVIIGIQESEHILEHTTGSSTGRHKLHYLFACSFILVPRLNVLDSFFVGRCNNPFADSCCSLKL